jgi:multiple sugar transport system permease protein
MLETHGGASSRIRRCDLARLDAVHVVTGREATPPALAPRRQLARALALLAMSAAAVFFVVPMIWLLLAPTKTSHALDVGAPLSFGSFAQLARTWDELRSIQGGVVIAWLRNSAVYSLSGTAIAVGVAIPAGYGLAAMQFAGRRMLLTVTLIMMLVPFNALVLPLFLEMHDFHLLGGPLSVILPFAFFPFGVYLVYLYIDSAVPGEVLAAARIDGCSEWKAFRHVAAPMAMPIVPLVVLFSFVGNWGNYFVPFVMLQQLRQLPLAVGLQQLSSGTPVVAMALVLSAAPVVVVLLGAQRALASGRGFR